VADQCVEAEPVHQPTPPAELSLSAQELHANSQVGRRFGIAGLESEKDG